MTPPAVNDGEPLLRLTDVSVAYSGRRGWRAPPPVRAVDGVSLDIRRGEAVGLVGESGCGKSSLARAVVRLIAPTGGSILFEGQDITRMGARRLKPFRRRIQMVFQDPYSALDPRARIGTTLTEPLAIHGLARGRRPERVAELLRLVGLDPDMAARFPHEFSGGQRQRIGIARALAVEPALLVCDEPTSALDVSIQAQILNLLADLRERLGLTLLFISHNLPAVAMISDRIAVMDRGRIVEVAAPETLRTAAAHPYTRALLSAVPVADPAGMRPKRILLPTAEPAGEAGGCSFRSRCWLYRSLDMPGRCAREDPALLAATPGHLARCHFTVAAKSGSVTL